MEGEIKRKKVGERERERERERGNDLPMGKESEKNISGVCSQARVEIWKFSFLLYCKTTNFQG